MKDILFASALLAMSGMAALGGNLHTATGSAPSSDPSEITMILSGLGLVALGLKRKSTGASNSN